MINNFKLIYHADYPKSKLLILDQNLEAYPVILVDGLKRYLLTKINKE